MEEYQVQVLDELKKIAEKIERDYPRFVRKTSFANQREMEEEGFLNDLQKRLSDIYAVIQAEQKAQDKRLNFTYAQTLERYPEEIKSLLNLFYVLAICLKTKLNLATQYNLGNTTLINTIDDIAFHCYNLKSILDGKADPKLTRAHFNKGVTDKLEYTYHRTGASQHISRSARAGQLVATRSGTAEEMSAHNSLVENAKKRLDENTPSFETTYISGNKQLGAQLKVTMKPQGLSNLAAKVVEKNKPVFTAALKQAGARVTDIHPELDVDYRAKFVREAKKVIDGVTFVPSEQEQTHLMALVNALKDEKSPHDAIHKVISAQRKQFTQAFFGPASSHENIKGIHNKIIVLMKQYQAEKAADEKNVNANRGNK